MLDSMATLDMNGLATSSCSCNALDVEHAINKQHCRGMFPEGHSKHATAAAMGCRSGGPLLLIYLMHHATDVTEVDCAEVPGP